MNIRTFKGFVSDESNWNESVDGLTKEFSFSTQTDLAEFLTLADIQANFNSIKTRYGL